MNKIWRDRKLTSKQGKHRCSAFDFHLELVNDEEEDADYTCYIHVTGGDGVDDSMGINNIYVPVHLKRCRKKNSIIGASLERFSTNDENKLSEASGGWVENGGRSDSH